MDTAGVVRAEGGAMGWVGDLVNIIYLTPDTRTAEVVGNFVVTDGSPQSIETPITGLTAKLLPDAILFEGGPGFAEIPDDTYVGFKFTDLVASPIVSARFDPKWGVFLGPYNGLKVEDDSVRVDLRGADIQESSLLYVDLTFSGSGAELAEAAPAGGAGSGETAWQGGQAMEADAVPGPAIGEGAPTLPQTWAGNLVNVFFLYPDAGISQDLGDHVADDTAGPIATPLENIVLFIGADTIRLVNTGDGGTVFAPGLDIVQFALTDTTARLLAGVEYDESSTIELAEGALTSSDDSVQINLAGAALPPHGFLLLDLVF